MLETQRENIGKFGDTLLTAVVNEQLRISKTHNNGKIVYLSSGENSLTPPPKLALQVVQVELV